MNISTGSRVTVEGITGWVIGWQGELAIVSLDDGRTVTVALSALRRAR